VVAKMADYAFGSNPPYSLRKCGYPPDLQEKATQTVLEQAEVLSEGWAVL